MKIPISTGCCSTAWLAVQHETLCFERKSEKVLRIPRLVFSAININSVAFKGRAGGLRQCAVLFCGVPCSIGLDCTYTRTAGWTCRGKKRDSFLAVLKLLILAINSANIRPHRTASHRTAPHRSTAPHRTAPHRTAPHRTAPHRTAPHRTAPHRTAPHRTAPHRTAPHRIVQ